MKNPIAAPASPELLRSYVLNGRRIHAKACLSGVFVDPVLPANFSNTANEARPATHGIWWDVPYIETYTIQRLGGGVDESQWIGHWPTGTRYDVRCLDGGAWDRPTCWGMFATMEKAIECAKGGPSWRRERSAFAPIPRT